MARQELADGARQELADGARQELADGAGPELADGAGQDIADGARPDPLNERSQDVTEGAKLDMVLGEHQDARFGPVFSFCDRWRGAEKLVWDDTDWLTREAAAVRLPPDRGRLSSGLGCHGVWTVCGGERFDEAIL
ncbi:hypothetical protein P8C59_005894 [Phyllachora maydis]|uniref:Uncharacterized protein n=1 Tax=Phyllachora maydis TaxID=1825666 RepID=A0AAD9I6X7_9PEZI|nr:hypothetical protein P8C59_005894 [Phyllachora maydis]